MKTIAFALDPDGYWIEIVGRGVTNSSTGTTGSSGTTTTTGSGTTGIGISSLCASPFDMYNYSQTMLRVKDPVKSISFYRDVLGMALLTVHHFSDFSLYFLSSLPTQPIVSSDAVAVHPYNNKNNTAVMALPYAGLPENLPEDLRENSPPECADFVKSLWRPVLELTHNHGTEKKDDFSYHNGNSDPQGFGHIAFTCDELQSTVDEITNRHPEVKFKKRPEDGKMSNVAFLLDPDGYFVELLPTDFTTAGC
eukprot:GHVS01062625.1.p1 GENE.GHVS01062625.1~~GHVS01062625.1.p1  ORF type:complete len:251 (+),score=49.45 GHVS01062625.1:319-1071(+)